MKKILVVVASLFLLSPPNVLAEGGPCIADFTCDQDVDGEDLTAFLNQFGRGQYSDPCPDCYDSPCPCTGAGCDPPAPVEKTGQTTSYATGDDGDHEKGVAWPNPRFTDNLDGTVTDSLTGLIWLKNANCFGTRTWNNSLSDSNGLGSGSCGLTDGSSAGQWRLPNHKEIFSLIDAENNNPALPSGHPFTNVQSSTVNYWSSTTYSPFTPGAWYVGMDFGDVNTQNKSFDGYVWPVRDDDLPPPRFTDNGDGTLTDNDTELIWLKDAFCDDINDWGNGLNWDDAMAAAAGLNHGECGLTDGSSEGSWRLPTKEEWEAFVCGEYPSPHLCNTVGDGPWSEGDPFYSVQFYIFECYWTGTEFNQNTAWIYEPYLSGPTWDQDAKSSLWYVWPVR